MYITTIPKEESFSILDTYLIQGMGLGKLPQVQLEEVSFCSIAVNTLLYSIGRGIYAYVSGLPDTIDYLQQSLQRATSIQKVIRPSSILFCDSEGLEVGSWYGCFLHISATELSDLLLYSMGRNN